LCQVTDGGEEKDDREQYAADEEDDVHVMRSR
jgi:hypothetical protein